jgi:hypothetical protein
MSQTDFQPGKPIKDSGVHYAENVLTCLPSEAVRRAMENRHIFQDLYITRKRNPGMDKDGLLQPLRHLPEGIKLRVVEV